MKPSLTLTGNIAPLSCTAAASLTVTANPASLLTKSLDWMDTL